MKKCFSLLLVFVGAFAVLGQGLTIRSAFYLPAVASHVSVGPCPDDGSPSEAQTTASNSSSLGDVTSANIYIGQMSWDPGTSRSICKLGFYLNPIGDISGRTYKAYVYTMSGNDLNSVVASSSAVSGSSLVGGFNQFALTSDASVVSGTPYALVIKKETGANSDTDHLDVFWAVTPTPDISGTLGLWDSGGVNTFGGSFDAAIRFYWR